MPIQYRFFSIPLRGDVEAENELNQFLKTIQALSVHRELICQEGRYYWALAVEYGEFPGKQGKYSVSGRKRIDYREVLSPEDFSIFARLRDWRKETAGREAVQLYSVFTNEQLATRVQKRVTTKNKLQEIEGIGDARVEKYGEAVITLLKNAFSNQRPTHETG